MMLKILKKLLKNPFSIIPPLVKSWRRMSTCLSLPDLKKTAETIAEEARALTKHQQDIAASLKKLQLKKKKQDSQLRKQS